MTNITHMKVKKSLIFQFRRGGGFTWWTFQFQKFSIFERQVGLLKWRGVYWRGGSNIFLFNSSIPNTRFMTSRKQILSSICQRKLLANVMAKAWVCKMTLTTSKKRLSDTAICRRKLTANIMARRLAWQDLWY